MMIIIDLKSCKMTRDTNVELLSISSISYVLFIKVKVNIPKTHLVYWIIPADYQKQSVTDLDVVRYGTYLGTFSNEIVTFSTVDAYHCVWNTLYIAEVSESCIKRIIKRRFLPFLVCCSFSLWKRSLSHLWNLFICFSKTMIM